MSLPRYVLLSKLALCDLWYDRKVSFCVIASLVAVIAPLLLLFSLKFGIVSQLQSQLLNDPQNLEVKIVGNLNLSKAWFDWLNVQPETQFSIPLTRSLNTIVDLRHASNGHFASEVELLPTKANDPLLNKQVLTDSKHIILSALAAEKLATHVGDTVQIIVTRNKDNVIEKAPLPFTVQAILPESTVSRAMAFVDLATLIGIEDFRDGIATPLFPHSQGQARTHERTTFARARIYANSLDNVAVLAAKLRENHIDTRTQAKAIENVKAIDGVLNTIFMVIACTSVVGCILSLIGAFLANIDRKRKDIALLRLLGFQTSNMISYLIFQAVALSVVAFALSYAFFAVGNQLFNTLLTSHLSDTHFVSRLHPIHLLIAFCISIVLAALVASIGALRATKIQPSESLRDV